MAVVKKGNRVSDPKAGVADWDGLMRSLSWPAGLSIKDRISLFKRGRRDARHGLVEINEYGEISSMYCETLVQAANQRIALEWTKCHQAVHEAWVQVEEIRLKRDELDRRLQEATVRRDEGLDAIRSRHYTGDDVVSEHLSNRRRLNREAPVKQRYEGETRAINDAMLAVDQELIPYRYNLSQAEEIARSHEQLVRADYLWRLSLYAYGASSYIRVAPDMVNDSALSDEPRRKFEEALEQIMGDDFSRLGRQ